MDVDLTAEQQRRLAELVAIYPVADELGARFAAAGHELYLVGGTVRDTLLEGAADDLDFATSARPEETEALLRGWADDLWLTGARFGTVSANRDGWKLELTTFRADSYQPGSRKPDVTYGSAITDDLARRDLTVNAMAVRLPADEHRFVDPFGGLADLHRRLLRTPVDAERSFRDDPLRMVRLARFAAVLDAEIDPEAWTAASRLAEQLDTISRERIRDELTKLLGGRAVAKGLDMLCATGLAERFLPELPALRMQVDPLHHHKDVYSHTLAVVEGCPADDHVLRLAALLHDIGKPATRAFHSGGKVTFHHHEVVGARMARQRLQELRYPKDEIEAVCHLIVLHLRFHGYGDAAWTDSAVRRYVRDAGSERQLRRLNALSRADVTTQNARKRQRLARAMDDLEARIEHLQEQEELANIRPPVDGNEVMRYLDLSPGPLVGEALRMLLDERLERGPYDADEAYALLREWAAKRELAVPEEP